MNKTEEFQTFIKTHFPYTVDRILSVKDDPITIFFYLDVSCDRMVYIKAIAEYINNYNYLDKNITIRFQ